MKQWFKNNRNGENPCMRERAGERESGSSTNTCMPFTKFMSMNQTMADQRISSNHADAYPNVGTTHTSHHFANQLTFLPKAPSRDPFKGKLYI